MRCRALIYTRTCNKMARIAYYPRPKAEHFSTQTNRTATETRLPSLGWQNQKYKKYRINANGIGQKTIWRWRYTTEPSKGWQPELQSSDKGIRHPFKLPWEEGKKGKNAAGQDAQQSKQINPLITLKLCTEIIEFEEVIYVFRA